MAKEEDIPLVFMISPYQGIIESEQMIFNRCGEIAAEEGIPFLDFNRMYDELGLDPQTDMAEASHLNYRGAVIWLGGWRQTMIWPIIGAMRLTPVGRKMRPTGSRRTQTRC